jgi:6-phosphogluconolactonase
MFAARMFQPCSFGASMRRRPTIRPAGCADAALRCSSTQVHSAPVLASASPSDRLVGRFTRLTEQRCRKFASTLADTSLSTLLVLSLCTLGCAASAPAARPDTPVVRVPFVYVGGYRPQISIFRLDQASGKLTPVGQAPAGTAPSFLAWDPAGRHLFAVDEIDAGKVLAFAIDPHTGGLRELGEAPSAGSGPAHLSVDRSGHWVLVANYADKKSGTIASLPIGPDGRLGAVVDTRDYGPASMPHMIATDPTNGFVFVPCKGGPFLAQLIFDPATGKMAPNDPDRIATRPRSGPRHLDFHPSKDVVYLINEQEMAVVVYSFDRGRGRLAELQSIGTLPKGAPMGPGYSTAEIEAHPSGKFVYGSNRGHNSIVIYRVEEDGRLALVGHEKRTISKPRHFSLDPSGALLLVANQGSDSVSVFAIDQNTGTLTPMGQPTPAGKQPSFVGTIMLP